MARLPQLRLSLEHELVIDQFAGGGGASLGMEIALGRSPDIAINHDPEAVALHQANHPTTEHYCESVWDVDPRAVCKGRPVGLMWLSPDCKHFSKAKGGKPVEKKIRGLAWIGVKWARLVRPRVIVLENVEEFQTWGPLTEDNKPCPLRKGLTFKRWVGRLRNLGYAVEWRELRACDFGAPTIRKRLFVIARCDGMPIVWPEPTHAQKPGKGLKPWRTAAECIDWSIPCPSIFERERPLAENTLRRIAAGIKRYVIDAAEPFIVPLTHQGDPTRTESIAEPMRTVTGAKRGEKALVAASIARIGQTGRGGHYTKGADEPLTTVTSKAEHLLVGANLVGVGGRAGQSRPRSADEPMATLTAKADTALVMPYLVDSAHGEVSPTGVKRWGKGHRSLEQPVPTVTAQGGNSALIAPTLVQTGYGERDGQAPRALDIGKPLGTMVGSQKHALVSAFLAQHNSDSAPKPGRPADAPISTITSSGSHQQLVSSNLVKLRGTCKDGQRTDAPAPTITGGGTHIAEVRAFLIAYYGTEQDPRLTDPMHTVPTRDRFGLVTVQGEPYVIADIGMRMLAPRELYRAQGFPYWCEKRVFLACLGSAKSNSTPVTSAENSSCEEASDALLEPVAVRARIGFGQMRLELLNREKFRWSALGAGASSSSRLPMAIADSVLRLAAIGQTAGKATRDGLAASRSGDALSTHPSRGPMHAERFGNATTVTANGVGHPNAMATVALMSITSPAGRNSRDYDSHWKTLCSFVDDAIGSSIQNATSKALSFVVEIVVEEGYRIDLTYGGAPLTKTAQVRMCGNSVSPPVAAAIVAANFAFQQMKAAA